VVKKWYLDYEYARVGYVGEEYLVNITLLTPICAICLGAIDSCITNLPGFIYCTEIFITCKNDLQHDPQDDWKIARTFQILRTQDTNKIIRY
jgi:hypothetical protein